MCDCVLPEFYDEVRRKARKEHECCEQSCEIKPGDEYLVCTGKWDGEVYSHKVCLKCQDLRRWLEKQTDCCVGFTGLWSELRDSDLVWNEELEDGTEIEVSDSDEIELVDGKWRLKEIAHV